ncbi:MAG TPA: 6-phosphofructokinase [Methanocellales archaeon]|nr:6-phosphofructokinase [Methanocellales archaeon]
MKKIGFLTSGGDAPGMNACIRAIVRCGIYHGLDMIGIRRGYLGLINKEFQKFNRRSVANIIQKGGTIIETSRCNEMFSTEGRKKAIDAMQEEGIQACVVIGGDGSFRAAAAMGVESDIDFIGVPGTIDNDIWGTDYTVGFNTAVNTALDAIDRIRDTASAFQRIFFVEVMGRNSGFIALEVGLAGGAEEIIIPEKKLEIEDLCQDLRESFKRGKRSSIIIVAEGNQVEDTINIAKYVEMRLKVECRVCTLGHIQRGGSPTALDRILATRLGIGAVEGLLEGKRGCAVGEIKGSLVYTPFKETWENKKAIDEHYIRYLSMLSL